MICLGAVAAYYATMTAIQAWVPGAIVRPWGNQHLVPGLIAVLAVLVLIAFRCGTRGAAKSVGSQLENMTRTGQIGLVMNEGAEELICMRGPDGDKVMHAMIKIGSSLIMLADALPGMHEVAPAEVGHSTVGMWLYVDDVDTLYKRADDAGAEVIDELMDAFWGDRMGKVKDPFGHAWALASHVEDVPPAEMERRQEQWFASMGDDE